MKKILFITALLLTVAGCSTPTHSSSAMKPGQTAHKFEVKRTKELSADYLLFLPEGYDQDRTKSWPLILFLHGAGERGSDVWKVIAHGPPKIDTKATNFP